MNARTAARQSLTQIPAFASSSRLLAPTMVQPFGEELLVLAGPQRDMLIRDDVFRHFNQPGSLVYNILHTLTDRQAADLWRRHIMDLLVRSMRIQWRNPTTNMVTRDRAFPSLRHPIAQIRVRMFAPVIYHSPARLAERTAEEQAHFNRVMMEWNLYQMYARDVPRGRLTLL